MNNSDMPTVEDLNLAASVINTMIDNIQLVPDHHQALEMIVDHLTKSGILHKVQARNVLVAAVLPDNPLSMNRTVLRDAALDMLRADYDDLVDVLDVELNKMTVRAVIESISFAD